MAETPLKRHREETQMDDCEDYKRHKSYNHILSLLEAEAEEEEPTQDLSSLITTLQQELSSDSIFNPLSFPNVDAVDPENLTAASTILEDQTSSSSSSPSYSSSTLLLKEDEEEDDKDRVIRRLLEASDDELGIPNREVNGEVYDGNYEGFDGDGFLLCDGLWELEDEAANYYTLLQSELFM